MCSGDAFFIIKSLIAPKARKIKNRVILSKDNLIPVHFLEDVTIVVFEE